MAIPEELPMKRFALASIAFALLCGFSYEGAVLPVPGNLLPVPLVRQKEDFSCGDVSVLSVLRYYDFDKWSLMEEHALYKPMHTSSKAGTDPQPMAEFLRKAGLEAEVKTGTDATVEQIIKSLDQGNPVITCIQAWQDKTHVKDFKPWKTDWDDGHYVVAIGHDKKNLYFMDPSTDGKYTYIPVAQFVDRWHDVMGKDNKHTQHITIFISGTRKAKTSKRPTKTPEKKVTAIN
jgi:predicted double-glycine peptidase